MQIMGNVTQGALNNAATTSATKAITGTIILGGIFMYLMEKVGIRLTISAATVIAQMATNGVPQR